MVLDTAHLRVELFPGLEASTSSSARSTTCSSPTTAALVAEAQETLEPVILTPRECELLEVPQHTTALLTRRITIDVDGVVVALGHVLLRGDRSRYIYKRTVETAPRCVQPRPALDGTMRRLAARPSRPTQGDPE